MKHLLRYRHHDIELPDGTFVIGRAATCQLSLDDPLVSRSHAALVVDGDAVTIEDMGSRNGVKVNGSAVSGRYQVKSGDHLTIGSQELKYLFARENPADTLVQPATQRVPTCSGASPGIPAWGWESRLRGAAADRAAGTRCTRATRGEPGCAR